VQDQPIAEVGQDFLSEVCHAARPDKDRQGLQGAGMEAYAGTVQESLVLARAFGACDELVSTEGELSLNEEDPQNSRQVRACLLAGCLSLCLCCLTKPRAKGLRTWWPHIVVVISVRSLCTTRLA
jgi:hypothetical protein